jgi:hypothetical protein
LAAVAVTTHSVADGHEMPVMLETADVPFGSPAAAHLPGDSSA